MKVILFVNFVKTNDAPTKILPQVLWEFLGGMKCACSCTYDLESYRRC